MKKTITVLLALCMLLSILTGCSGQPQASGETTQPSSTAQSTVSTLADKVEEVQAPIALKYVFLILSFRLRPITWVLSQTMTTRRLCPAPAMIPVRALCWTDP